MSYKEKFDASEHKAHYKNIATKILRDMTELRSKVENSPTTPRRWVWELIQNAKDVHYDTGVDIEIEFKEDKQKLVFWHNGKPFSADNIRFLIEQISSKEREKDQHGKMKSTGKFGTGFMTTHMLSERVTVKGVAKEDGEDYRKFKFELDRSGFEINDIIKAVEKSKDSVRDLDSLPPYLEYQSNQYNTSFTYPLMDAISIGVAKHGLNDLQRCLPYSMAFVDEINSITISHTGETYTTDDKEEVTDYTIQNRKIYIDDDILGREVVTIAKLSKGLTSIAVPIKVDGVSIEILPIAEEIPKIFCDFPLIGTEIFPFPVIINNPNLNPTDARDGIFLNDSARANPPLEENKGILKEAVELYFKLLEIASKSKWSNLHLLAKNTTIKESRDWLSESWFNKEILTPIKTKLLYSKIVKTEDGNMSSILTDDNKHYIWFPYSNKKEIREKIWEVGAKWFPHVLPIKSDIGVWYKLVWDKCGKLTLEKFASFLEGRETIEKLTQSLKGNDAVKWLNDFFTMLQLDEKEFHLILEKKVIVPNQNNSFVKKSQLYEEIGIINPIFKDILKDLGNDIKEVLVKEGIELSFDRGVDEQYVVRQIIAEVGEKTNDREVAKNYRNAFNKLLIYFKDYPDEAKKLFPTIYNRKHLLYDDEEILENIGKAEKLNELLKEFNVTTSDALRELLSKQTESSGDEQLLPVTQEILLSMGITSIDAWKKALEDKDIQSLFSHSSVPTQDMFVYAQTHIEKAKAAVIEHLGTLNEYDLRELDVDTAPTILAGIYKHEQPISIVVRPAYNNEVIIYYSSERDVLDFEPSELWIEDPIEVRRISLGHILKTAQIRKFPV